MAQYKIYALMFLEQLKKNVCFAICLGESSIFSCWLTNAELFDILANFLFVYRFGGEA